MMSRITDKLDAARAAKSDRPTRTIKVVSVERPFRNRQVLLIMAIGLFGYLAGRTGSITEVSLDDLIAVTFAGGAAVMLFEIVMHRFEKDVVKPGDSLRNMNLFGLGFTMVMLAVGGFLLIVGLSYPPFKLEAYLVFGGMMMTVLVVSLYRPALLYWLLALDKPGSSESTSVDTPVEPVAAA